MNINCNKKYDWGGSLPNAINTFLLIFPAGSYKKSWCYLNNDEDWSDAAKLACLEILITLQKILSKPAHMYLI